MFSFKELNDKSKNVAVIWDTKENKQKEFIYMTERSRNMKIKEDDSYDEKIKNYVESSEDNKFILKEQYEFRPVPPKFTEDYMRQVLSIFGKSGSGKSWFTAKYVEAYANYYPEHQIFYISNNPIENDTSYSKNVRDKIQQIDLNTINKVIDFKDFQDCLFIFDDILDVDVSIDPNIVAEQLLSMKKGTEKKELNFKDQAVIDKAVRAKGKVVKSYILESISNLLYLARKQSVSVLITCHDLFSGREASKIIGESHNIVLFPYSNVSNKKLKDFLTTKASYDLDEASDLLKTEFLQYEYLSLNVNGRRYFMTPSTFKIL
jgi:hypothetical protein